MYRPVPDNRDRAVTIGAVVLIHLGLGYALLNAAGTVRPHDSQPDLQLIDILSPPPPPVVIEKIPEPEKPRPEKREAPAAPKNLENKATPVVAPKPRIVIPARTPVVAAPTAGTGAAANQGASDVAGSGTGAGGAGTGTGSGGSGSGNGGGGFAGPPRNATIIPATSLTLADFPPDVRRSWPRGGRVFVAVRVQLDGRATDCKINRSIGIPAIDQWTCRLLEQKGRFRPAIDERGQPTVAWYGYVQAWTGS